MNGYLLTFVEIGDSTYALSAVSDFAESNGTFMGRVMIASPDSPVEIITISNGTDGYTKIATQPLLPPLPCSGIQIQGA